MATVCFPTVRGRVARFTALDGCGRPKPGPCGTIVTDDIVSISASAEVEEGEEITVRNMAGKLCISDKPPSSVKWFTLEIVLCKVMPPLLSMTSNYEQVIDDKGDIIGYDVGANVDGNFALEVWGDVPGVQTCEGVQASGQFSYLLFPWVGGMTYSGDLEIQNDAFQPTLSGTTKTGSGWGVGPYDVTVDQAGDPSPMFTPIGPDKHFRHQIVYLDPPEPACECQELVDPDLQIGAVQTNPPDGLEVQLTGNKSTVSDLDWGDGTTAASSPVPTTHTYADPGKYVISATDPITGSSNETEVIVGPAPTISATSAALVTTLTTDQPATEYTINWGDGTTAEVKPIPVAGVTHTYAAAGTYSITALRTDTQKQGQTSVTVTA